MKNKYILRSKISEAKFRQCVRLFCVDLTATQIAQVARLNRNTVNRLLQGIRERIALACEAESSVSNEGAVDASSFDAYRVQGLKERGARDKTLVFGLLKRQGCVYTEIVPDCSKTLLLDIIQGRVDPESILHSDGWRGYNGLVDLGSQKYYRVQYGENECANEHNHINSIESFWAFAKTRLVRFRGLQKHMFYFHLKECEFRFNHRGEDVYKLVLKMCRDSPLC